MGRIISDRYEELGQLGQGSQGVVYKVRHIGHKTDLALKVLPSYLLEDQELVARFEQEAQMMTRLRHRNIARVLGSGRDETLKLHFIVLEYIEGKNLKQHLREKGPLPLPEVLEIARQIAGALDHAHNQSLPIIHRDIKPTNIMLEDLSGRVVVLDFGIAKELGEPQRSHTQTGVMLGTWKYCAPEQLRHEPLSGSADVYSLGMVMYEMYTGTPFFSGLDEHAVLGKVLYDQQEHEPYFARQTLPAFVSLVTKAIAKSRDKRYRRMADLLNDLEACWWALDDTRTVVLSPQSLTARLPDAPGEDIAELDAKILRLEEERQRHTVTALQSQVRIAKEQAERGGARQWASALFEQGLAREKEGETQNREQQYPQAQESYNAAIALFTQASADAHTNAAAQHIEKERQTAFTAKDDAERAGAHEQSNDLYARALTTLKQAEQFWEQQQGRKAEPLYRDARHLFEEARDFSYNARQREEAEAVREQAQKLRTTAFADGLATFAAPLFDEGQEHENQGTTALAHGDFSQAGRLYLAALHKYEHALRQAQRAQQRRQEVLTLAAHTHTLQQQALAAGQEVQHQAAYSQAEEFIRQATTLLDAREYTKAGHIYTQARDCYEAALRAVEEELQRKRIQSARDAAIAARQRAEAVEAGRWFSAAWNEGRQAEDAAQALVAREQWDDALHHYQQVREKWESLAVAAQQRHQQLTAAHEQMRIAQEAAAQVGAAQLCTEEWTEVIQSATRAQQHGDRGETTQAVTAFQQAEERFTQLRILALQRKAHLEEQQRQRAFAALHTAEENLTSAENAEAPQYAAVLYGQATQLLEKARPHLQATRWHEALPLLTQAQELLARATAHAPQEKARLEAEAAQAKALASQQETQKGRGPTYFPERFAQATTLLRHAEAALRRRDFSLAQRGFEEGAVLLQRIRQTAAIREQAEAELASLSVSELAMPEEETSIHSPVVSPVPVQPDQRKEPRPATPAQLHNRRATDKLPPAVPSAMPLAPRETEAPRSPLPSRTIPPTALLSGKGLGLVVMLTLLIIGGYLLRSRPADTPPTLAKTPEAPATPEAPPQARDEQKPAVSPPPSPTPREEVQPAALPKEQAPPALISPAAQPQEAVDPQIVKALSPPPPDPQLLTLQQAEPGPGEEFTLREGETLPFSVTVGDESKRSLRYRWTLNGAQQSTQATWRYKPKFDEADGVPKVIRVAVRDDTGLTVEREWRVRVLNVNRAPTITAATPRLGAVLTVAAGATQTFSVTATDPDKEGPLTYRWLLNGDEVGTAQTGHWQFQAPTNNGAHQLTVEIHDASGERIQQSWEVIVRTASPSLRWVRFQPKEERLRTPIGRPVQFSALAELLPSVRGVEKLHYQWRVNENVLETEDIGRFQFSGDQVGRYHVSVVALNGEIKSPTRQWEIEVQALDSSPTVQVPEERTAASRSVERCTSDVGSWIESYRRAWETKNVRTLVTLGVISRFDMDRVAENLTQYEVFQVALTDREIHCESDQATVSFKRVDTIDGTIVVHPERTIFQLEKSNGRWKLQSR